MTDEKKYTWISAPVIPVKIFVLFLVDSNREWTARQVIREFEKKHRMTLSPERVRQVLNDLVRSENLVKEVRVNNFQQKCGYYKFLKLE